MFSVISENYPKRYFICDFARAVITIAYSPSSIEAKTTHKLAFREFLEVKEFSTYENKIAAKNISSEYKHGFYVKST